jgi:hypothetical protein
MLVMAHGQKKTNSLRAASDGCRGDLLSPDGMADEATATCDANSIDILKVRSQVASQPK